MESIERLLRYGWPILVIVLAVAASTAGAMLERALLGLALAAGLAGAASARHRRPLARCTVVLLAAAILALALHLAGDEFGNRYTWLYSAAELPLHLKVGNLWGGEEGTLLLMAIAEERVRNPCSSALNPRSVFAVGSPAIGCYPADDRCCDSLGPRQKPRQSRTIEVVTEAASIEGRTSMRRLLVPASVALLSLAFASSASAESERPSFDVRSFMGFWEGIDPVDGGDSLRSITCFLDQSCNLAATDSIITLCGGGPGFAAGMGALEGNALVFPDVVLTCPDGQEVDLSIRYDRDAFNRTLVETTVVGGERTLPNIIFHKISR